MQAVKNVVILTLPAQKVAQFIAEQIKRRDGYKNRGAWRENYPRGSLEH